MRSISKIKIYVTIKFFSSSATVPNFSTVLEVLVTLTYIDFATYSEVEFLDLDIVSFKITPPDPYIILLHVTQYKSAKFDKKIDPYQGF